MMTSFDLNQEFEELVKATLTEKQTVTNSKNDNNNNNNNNKSSQEDMTDGSAKSPNSFQDNNSVKKLYRKYTTTRIKSRNFLSNISYVGINKEHFYNESLIFDIYVLMTKNLKSFFVR